MLNIFGWLCIKPPNWESPSKVHLIRPTNIWKQIFKVNLTKLIEKERTNLSTALRTSSARAVLDGFKQTSTAPNHSETRIRGNPNWEIIRCIFYFTWNENLVVCDWDRRNYGFWWIRRDHRLIADLRWGLRGGALKSDLHWRAHRCSPKKILIEVRALIWKGYGNPRNGDFWNFRFSLAGLGAGGRRQMDWAVIIEFL